MPDAFRQRRPWLIADLLRARDVRLQIAHFTGPEFATNHRRYPNIERIGDHRSQISNGRRHVRSDIDRQPVQRVTFHRQQVGAGDVFNKGHIARLLAILV